MTWSGPSRASGADGLEPTCSVEVNTRLVAGGMDTVDTASSGAFTSLDAPLSESAPGINGVSMSASEASTGPPPPSGSPVNTASMSPGRDRQRARPRLRKAAVRHPESPASKAHKAATPGEQAGGEPSGSGRPQVSIRKLKAVHILTHPSAKLSHPEAGEGNGAADAESSLVEPAAAPLVTVPVDRTAESLLAALAGEADEGTAGA